LFSSDELTAPCESSWALAVIGSDAKAITDTAMAKRRKNLSEGLQLDTIHPSGARFWGFVDLPLIHYNPSRMLLIR